MLANIRESLSKEYPYRIELHAHTNPASPCGKASPEEAVQLVTEKQYVSIEDHDLAVELIKSYGYPSTEDYENHTYDVGEDVKYFAQALYDIGFLTTEPEEYIKDAYTEVDLTLGQ